MIIENIYQNTVVYAEFTYGTGTDIYSENIFVAPVFIDSYYNEVGGQTIPDGGEDGQVLVKQGNGIGFGFKYTISTTQPTSPEVGDMWVQI